MRVFTLMKYPLAVAEYPRLSMYRLFVTTRGFGVDHWPAVHRKTRMADKYSSFSPRFPTFPRSRTWRLKSVSRHWNGTKTTSRALLSNQQPRPSPPEAATRLPRSGTLAVRSSLGSGMRRLKSASKTLEGNEPDVNHKRCFPFNTPPTLATGG